MNISLIPTAEVPNLWMAVLPFLEKATERFSSRYSAIDIYEELLTGQQSLWIAFEDEIVGAWTVRINEYPQNRVLNIEWLGGDDATTWLGPALEVMHNYAEDMGCTLEAAIARPGWKNHAKKLGFRMVAVIYEREVG